MVYWVVVLLVAVAVSASPNAVFPEVYNDAVHSQAEGSRIVSGWESEEGQFPYQISLRMVNPVGTVNACGGSIIHEEWGLTAAHCTATRTTMVIRAGVVNLTTPYYIFETTEYYNHPAYIDELQSVVQPNDIALLKFNRRLTFNDLVQPIRIQASEDKNKDYTGATLIATGWGRTWTNGAAPENMNWVYLHGVSNGFCALVYNSSPIIQDSTICASYYNVTSQSTCQGDSGGVLAMYEEDGVISQIGVTSFVSSSGCHTEIPAGFIRAGYYHDWYQEVTGINFDRRHEEILTTTEAVETTTEAVETTTESFETTTVAVETTTVAVETTTEAVETTTVAVETTTVAVETTTVAVETTTEALETTTVAVETTTEAVETTTVAVETTTESVETTTVAVETTTEAVETTTVAVETTTEAVETTTVAVETTTVAVETTTEAVETTIVAVETTTVAVEITTEAVETTTVAVETTTETVQTTTEAVEITTEAEAPGSSEEVSEETSASASNSSESSSSESVEESGSSSSSDSQDDSASSEEGKLLYLQGRDMDNNFMTSFFRRLF